MVKFNILILFLLMVFAGQAQTYTDETTNNSTLFFVALNVGNQPFKMRKMDLQYYLRDRNNNIIDSTYKTTGGIYNIFGYSVLFQYLKNNHSLGLGVFYIDGEVESYGFNVEYFKPFINKKSFNLGISFLAGYRNDELPIGIMHNPNSFFIDINNKQFNGEVATSVSVSYINLNPNINMSVNITNNLWFTAGFGYGYNAMVSNKLIFEGFTTTSAEKVSTAIDLKSASLYKYTYPDMDFSRFNYTDIKAQGITYFAGLKYLLYKNEEI